MKTKRGLKYYAAWVFTITLMLTMAVSVSASNGAKTLEVIYSDIQLVVDGIKVDLGLDTSGNAIEPFILNGTTYLPVRAVAEALGEDVGWDGETKTVFIGKRNVTDESEKYIGNGIEYLDYREGDYRNDYGYFYKQESAIADILGNTYNSYLYLSVSTYWTHEDERWNYIEFPTNGQYSRFRATLGLSEDTKLTNASGQMEVYADDVLVGSYTVESGMFTEEIDVDIKKALVVKMKLNLTDISGESNGEFDTKALLGNPRFVE